MKTFLTNWHIKTNGDSVVWWAKFSLCFLTDDLIFCAPCYVTILEGTKEKKNIIDQQLYKFEMILPFHTGFPSWERLGLIKSLPYMRNISSDDKIFEKNYIHSWFSDS